MKHTDRNSRSQIGSIFSGCKHKRQNYLIHNPNNYNNKKVLLWPPSSLSEKSPQQWDNNETITSWPIYYHKYLLGFHFWKLYSHLDQANGENNFQKTISSRVEVLGRVATGQSSLLLSDALMDNLIRNGSWWNRIVMMMVNTMIYIAS